MLKKGGTSLRSSKPSWQLNNNIDCGEKYFGDKIFVYILGGVSYSEIRDVHDVAKKYQRDITVGSSSILTPNSFIQQINIIN